jgi:hypothetical protein
MTSLLDRIGGEDAGDRKKGSFMELFLSRWIFTGSDRNVAVVRI